jgi:hypothetical protein
LLSCTRGKESFFFFLVPAGAKALAHVTEFLFAQTFGHLAHLTGLGFKLISLV